MIKHKYCMDKQYKDFVVVVNEFGFRFGFGVEFGVEFGSASGRAFSHYLNGDIVRNSVFFRVA
jgi:hypothetical protein